MAKNTFAKNIKKLRNATGLNKEDFGEEIQINPSTIRQAEAGVPKRELTDKNTKKYVDVFLITEEDLKKVDLSDMTSNPNIRKILRLKANDCSDNELINHSYENFLNLKINSKIKNKDFIEAYYMIENSDENNFLANCVIAKYKFLKCYSKNHSIYCLYNYVILSILEWCFKFTPKDFTNTGFISTRIKILNFRKQTSNDQIEYFNKNYEKLNFCLEEIKMKDVDFVDFYIFVMNCLGMFKYALNFSNNDVIVNSKSSFIKMIIHNNKYMNEMCNLIY